MISQYSSDAKVFKALCDEKRLMILELLQSGEKCVCVLCSRENGYLGNLLCRII